MTAELGGGLSSPITTPRAEKEAKVLLLARAESSPLPSSTRVRRVHVQTRTPPLSALEEEEEELERDALPAAFEPVATSTQRQGGGGGGGGGGGEDVFGEGVDVDVGVERGSGVMSYGKERDVVFFSEWVRDVPVVDDDGGGGMAEADVGLE